MSENFPRAAVPLLLQWFNENARDLPWRRNVTPYKVLISEIMLQQTRVDTVIPYFLRFIQTLPDFKTLAAIDEDGLLKLWEGLGYYSRVRNLQKTAQLVEKDYNGDLPADYEKLLKLPGLGPYSAGSVASIAFGLPYPAVDGNAYRVVTRLLNFKGNIAEPKTQKLIRSAVAKIMPEDAPGKFNQALMELGALLCLPKNQAGCAECPIAELCEAHKAGTVTELPVKLKEKPRKIEPHTILLIEADGKFLLHKRAQTGLLAGLWEYINFQGFLKPAEIKQRLSAYTTDFTLHQLPPAKHIFTHLEWHMQAYYVRLKALPPEKMQDAVWVSLEDLNGTYALPSAFKFYTDGLEGYRKNLKGFFT